MNTKRFSEYLSKLDNTTKRLEITSILAELLAELNSTEIDKAIYLLTGNLDAQFIGTRFNIADKMVIRILENAFSTTNKIYAVKDIEEMYRSMGDLGDVAYELAKDKDTDLLNLVDLHNNLLEIAQLEGSGSQDAKIQNTAKLLKSLDRESVRYITRIILGTTRLGFTELTIIDALALTLGDKKLADVIEGIYNVHPDLGLISKRLKDKGIKGLKNIGIETGVPVLSQKAQRVSGMEEAVERLKDVWAEFKFDGTRVQLHMDRNKTYKSTKIEQNSLFPSVVDKMFVKTYTRNLDETTHQYPDITEAAASQIKADSIILDGEAIGYNPETNEFLPFQETMQRKRKHGIGDMAKSVPLRYYVFDILYLNGESLISKPLRERREILKGIIKPGPTIIPDEYFETKDIDELAEYFEIAKEKGLEGLVVKNPNDPYQAGARSYSWIKLKKADEKLLEDSIDCVVLGYYSGKGGRSKFGIGGFLAGIYDKTEDTFKTITKVGTGLTEDEWELLKSRCDKHLLSKKPANVEIEKILEPDVYVKPYVMVEIGADEITISPTHSAKYALRFPRLIKFREDKKPTEATTLEEIVKMYKDQKTKYI